MNDPITALATNGTIAPGRANHHQLEGLSGRWTTGTVKGHLQRAGWAAAIGFPGITLSSDGEEVEVHLFISDDLTTHWARLDAFEGRDYTRTRVIVHTSDGPVPAYIYQWAAD